MREGECTLAMMLAEQTSSLLKSSNELLGGAVHGSALFTGNYEPFDAAKSDSGDRMISMGVSNILGMAVLISLDN